MGIVVTYFAASDDELRAVDVGTGPSPTVPRVDSKGLPDAVDDLVSELVERDLVENVRPTAVAADGESAIVAVAQRSVSALARIDDRKLREFAKDHLLENDELALITNLRDLAQMATETRRGVYRWVST